MIYLANRVRLGHSIAVERVLEEWQQFTQDIEYFNRSTWKVWQTTQIISGDGKHTRVFHLNGQRHSLKTVGVSCPCYLRLEPDAPGSTFTMLSSEKEALVSVTSLIENIYAPTTSISLEEFLQQNQTLSVQAARIFYPSRDCETLFTFDQSVTLSDLLNRDREPPPTPAPQLLSLSITVNNIESSPLNVHTFYVNRVDHQVGFSVETDLLKEDELIDSLFTLVDRTFKGKWQPVAL